MVKAGQPKLVAAVDEITFSGAEALKAGKKMFYVTHLGAFQLTSHGLQLVLSVPGVPPEAVVRMAPDAMVSVSPHVEVVPACVVSGGKEFDSFLPRPRVVEGLNRLDWVTKPLAKL